MDLTNTVLLIHNVIHICMDKNDDKYDQSITIPRINISKQKKLMKHVVVNIALLQLQFMKSIVYNI